MDSGRRSTSGASKPGGAGVSAFLYLGFIGILGFSGLHLLFCLLTSWVIGHDFSTVVYVTAAAVITATLITFTFAFLVALNLVITAFSNFGSFGQNIFGGAGGPGIGGQSQRSSDRPSFAYEQNSSNDFDETNMKLD